MDRRFQWVAPDGAWGLRGLSSYRCPAPMEPKAQYNTLNGYIRLNEPLAKVAVGWALAHQKLPLFRKNGGPRPTLRFQFGIFAKGSNGYKKMRYSAKGLL